jgi:hypothetical protein
VIASLGEGLPRAMTKVYYRSRRLWIQNPPPGPCACGPRLACSSQDCLSGHPGPPRPSTMMASQPDATAPSCHEGARSTSSQNRPGRMSSTPQMVATRGWLGRYSPCSWP